jgi:hypothetical protein
MLTKIRGSHGGRLRHRAEDLKMESLCDSEPLVSMYESAQRHNPVEHRQC